MPILSFFIFIFIFLQAFGLHSTNGGPASLLSANLVQQQHSISPMYPQVHIPHFSNFIPYRQVNPPVYVPPMAVPGFSSNLAYHHPANGNNYFLFPGFSSHPSTNNLKYAPSQIKGAPVGGPASYGNFTNPDVYPIGTSRNMGTTDLEDVSRIKCKDGNMFVSNLQVSLLNNLFCWWKFNILAKLSVVSSVDNFMAHCKLIITLKTKDKGLLILWIAASIQPCGEMIVQMNAGWTILFKWRAFLWSYGKIP